METIVGIDIGGTSIKMGLVNRDGQIIGRAACSTQDLKTVAAFLGAVEGMLRRLLTDHEIEEAQLLGIGLGAPGHSTSDGRMLNAVNLPVRSEIPIGPHLAEVFSLPAYMIKDAKASALGEKYWGAGQATDNFVLLMLGTGLGFAAYLDGQISNGHLGLSGELGHSTFILNGRKCNCGKRGCTETYVSATGLKRTAFELMATDNRQTPLKNYAFNDLNTEIIANFALEGDPVAKEAFDKTAYYLGILMANLCEQFTPERFILAGGLAKAGDLLTLPAKEVLNNNIQAVYKNHIQIQLSSLGSGEVGILGAAALVLENQISQTQLA